MTPWEGDRPYRSQKTYRGMARIFRFDLGSQQTNG